MARLNVLLIVMDDQRSDTIASLGNVHIRTPNLDALARSGAFVRPYTTVPVCTPARAELLTGRDAFHNGCRWFDEPIDRGLTLLPQALGEAGYHCAHFGKWHNDGHPRRRGYNETHRVFPQDLVGGYYRPGVDWRGTHDFIYRENGVEVRGHSTELIAQPVIEFLQRSAPTQPWFCFVGFHSPHDPRAAPEPWASMYSDATIPIPRNYMPEHPFDTGDLLIRDELLAQFPRAPDEVLDHVRDYYAMISHHDEYIGRILAALRSSGQYGNTIIVFTSDHGLAIGSHGLMGKQNLYEHSARVPLIFAGPGIPPGTRIDEDCLCAHYDFMPTLCDLLDIPVPKTSLGVSYARVLRGKQRTVRKHMFGAYRDRIRMARDSRYKVIHYLRSRRTQLFYLISDPQETRDLLVTWRMRGFAGENAQHYKPILPAYRVHQIEQSLSRELAEWRRFMTDEE
jgi:arylsulfatase A-like enzyme